MQKHERANDSNYRNPFEFIHFLFGPTFALLRQGIRNALPRQSIFISVLRSSPPMLRRGGRGRKRGSGGNKKGTAATDFHGWHGHRSGAGGEQIGKAEQPRITRSTRKEETAFIRVIGVIRGGFFFYRELRQAREFPERGRRQAGNQERQERHRELQSARISGDLRRLW
jgi:hypothetical protein